MRSNPEGVVMFSAIEKLARGGTLLVTVCKEDDHALRVGVTQVPTSSKTEQTLRPLSLIGTAAELDAGFAEAVSIWQAPRKSLAEQARAAAADEEDDADAQASKPKTSGSKRAPKAQADKQKLAASAATAAPAGEEATSTPGADAAAGASDGAFPAPSADAAADAGGEAASAPSAAPIEVAEDVFTLDLF
jgi:PRTRC genetic system protein E